MVWSISDVITQNKSFCLLCATRCWGAWWGRFCSGWWGKQTGGPWNAEEGLAQSQPQRISPSGSCYSLKVFSWSCRCRLCCISWKGSTRSSAKESGDGVWEQIKSVWRIFSSLRWEVGAVRRSKGTAAGSQHRNCCRYRRWEMEGGWEGLLHVHSTGSPTSSGGVGGRASLWIKLNPPLCRTIETGRACKKN